MEGMDVDLDPELMQKFSCLGTTDKDVLISEFQRLLGFQLNPAGCAFFLDMTNCAGSSLGTPRGREGTPNSAAGRARRVLRGTPFSGRGGRGARDNE
ncbi:hypothetical protein P7K49_007820 [Saguinus oedipus]|uniref:Uncharacterized protein n=1 Tax=Saguinus oedipus TaxID=9490 RepID=A0ABQ9VVY2_SAGOE|nr:hypothetical protein P7K49_007820 [Saguinus oedipus]